MRFLHTADWHVGKPLRGRSRLDEYAAALDEDGLRDAGELDAGQAVVVRAAAEETVDGLDYLALQFAPFDPADGRLGNAVTSERRIISTGFEQLTFEYYGSEQDREPPAWKRVWRDDAAYYPRAIRIRTHWEGGKGGWPESLVSTERIAATVPSHQRFGSCSDHSGRGTS